MKKFLIAAVAAFALAACGQPATTAETEAPVVPALTADAPNLVAAVSDSRRPAEDTARDANRHPAETLAFAEVRPGARVGEFIAGGGYFTRLLAVAAGDDGRVYPVVRPEATVSEWELPVVEVAAQYPNTQVVRADFNTMTFPEPLDVFFSAQNYHDLALTEYGLGDRNAVNRAAFAALKPGGVYLLIDHSAVAGTPVATDAETTNHRIDQATVRQEVEAAGFVYDGEADFLRNPEDARTASVFDEAIRGHTDQFVMRFRKPAA